MRELDNKRFNDKPLRDKICTFCRTPELVDMTKTAKDHIGLDSIQKAQLLEALEAHVSKDCTAILDRMDNGDEVIIVENCIVGKLVLYVKVKFYKRDDRERMFVISAHTPRKW